MPLRYEEQPKKQDSPMLLNSPAKLKWEEADTDVNAPGLATGFLSGMARATFQLTGGGAVEYFFDDLVPNDPYGFKLVGSKAVDWGKDHTLVNYEPQNSAERVAERAGHDLVAGAVVAAAALSTSGTSLAIGLGTKASTTQRIMSNMIMAVKNNPMAASILEMSIAGGAGAAMQAAEEAGGGPVAQQAAGLSAAVAPLAPVMAYKGLQYTSMGLFNKMFKASNKKAFQEVAKALDTGIGDMSDVSKSNRVFQDIGAKTRPSVAEASNSPQLIARQRQIEAEAVGSELDTYVARHKSLLSDVESRAEALGPEANFRDQETIIDVSRATLNAQRSRVAGEIDDVTSLIAVTGRRLPQATDRMVAGKALRGMRDTIRKDVSDAFSEEADDIGLNNLGSEFDATDFRDTVRGAFFDRRSKFAAKIKNKTLKRINRMEEEVGPDGKPNGRVSMTWEDLTAIRETLDDDISVLLSTGQRNKARPLINAKGMLDDFVDNNAPNGVDPKAWQSFRARYKTEFIERFEKGTSYKVGGANKRGEYFTNDEMVAEAFLRNETTVADFFRLYGGDAEEALPLLRTAILDKARSASVRDGIVNEKGLSKFIESGPMSKVLRQFPTIRMELQNVAMAKKALSVRSAQLKARANEIEASQLANIVGLSNDPNTMLTAALKDPRKMQALVDASMSAGLGRRPVASLVWRRAIENISAKGEPTPEQLLKFIDNNRPALNVALGERHATALRNIYDATEIINRVKAPKGSVEAFGLPDQLREKTGISVPQVASRYFAINYGLIGKRQMMIESAMRFYGKFAGRKAKALMKEALYDENIARDIQRLMDSPSLQRSDKLKSLPEQRLNAALFTMGFGEKEQ